MGINIRINTIARSPGVEIDIHAEEGIEIVPKVPNENDWPLVPIKDAAILSSMGSMNAGKIPRCFISVPVDFRYIN